MSVLDLQGMDAVDRTNDGAPAGGINSNASLLLCGGGSTLSVGNCGGISGVSTLLCL